MGKIEFTVQMDEDLKKQLDAVCDDIGMTPSTAINMFAKAFIKERASSGKMTPPVRPAEKRTVSNYKNGNREGF